MSMPDDEENIAFIAHVEKSLGRPASVFELEQGSNKVNIGLISLGPVDEDPCWRFLTLGMSAQELNFPQDHPFPRRMELMMSLRHDHFDHFKGSTDIIENLQGDEWRAVRYMLEMAHFVHNEDASYSIGISYGDPADDLGPAKGFPGAMIHFNDTAPKALMRHNRSDGTETMISSVVPLRKEELKFKMSKTKSLGRFPMMLRKAGVTEVFQPERQSIIRKKIFGIF